MRRALPVIAVVALLLAGLWLLDSPGPGTAPPVAMLAADLEELRAAFNRDAGKLRLLLIVDPT